MIFTFWPCREPSSSSRAPPSARDVGVFSCAFFWLFPPRLDFGVFQKFSRPSLRPLATRRTIDLSERSGDSSRRVARWKKDTETLGLFAFDAHPFNLFSIRTDRPGRFQSIRRLVLGESPGRRGVVRSGETDNSRLSVKVYPEWTSSRGFLFWNLLSSPPQKTAGPLVFLLFILFKSCHKVIQN